MEKKQYDFSKVELHCHLDGCYRVETVAEVAKKRGIDMPSYDPEVLKQYITAHDGCASLDEFLQRMAVAVKAFGGDADAIRRLVTEAVEDKARDKVKYIEFRYCPQLLANCDVTPLINPSGNLRPKDVVDVVNDALEKAATEHGMTARTILCDITVYIDFYQKTLTKSVPTEEIRAPFKNDWATDVLELCKEYKGKGVVGYDVAGPEHDPFSQEVEETYRRCASLGIHRTAHAGEVGPASRVKQAIEKLEVERIGHGYHTVDDDDVLNLAKQKNTHFEVCLLSSHLTSAYNGPWSSHPAKKFMSSNMNFGLNTDDPGPNTYGIIRDYDIATGDVGFSVNDLLDLNMNAARSCFLEGAEKEQLLNDLKSEYDQYRHKSLNVSSSKCSLI